MTRYHFISTQEVQGCLPVMFDGKWGLVDYEDYDNEIFPPMWDTIPQEEKYGFIKIINKGKQGLVNKEGVEILPAIYENIEIKEKDIIVVTRIDDRCAIVNEFGEELIPFDNKYKKLVYYSKTRIIAYCENKCGVITLGSVKVNCLPICFDDLVVDEDHEVYKGIMNGLYGVTSFKGVTVVPHEFEDIVLGKANILVKSGGKWGAFDYQGHSMLSCKYDLLDEANLYEKFIAKQGDLYGIVCSGGKEITDFKYTHISDFRRNHAIVTSKDGKKGFIDLKCKEICPLVYEDVGHFSYGRAPVKSDGGWGFIDEKGNLVIKTKYSKFENFKDEYAIVCYNNKWTVINNKGIELVPTIYDSINISSKDYATVVIGNNEGIVKLN